MRTILPIDIMTGISQMESRQGADRSSSYFNNTYGLFQMDLRQVGHVLSKEQRHPYTIAFQGITVNTEKAKAIYDSYQHASQQKIDINHDAQELIWLIYFAGVLGSNLKRHMKLGSYIDGRRVTVGQILPGVVGPASDTDFNTLCSITAKYYDSSVSPEKNAERQSTKVTEHHWAFQNLRSTLTSLSTSQKNAYLNMATYNNGFGLTLQRVVDEYLGSKYQGLSPFSPDGWWVSVNDLLRYIGTRITLLNNSTAGFSAVKTPLLTGNINPGAQIIENLFVPAGEDYSVSAKRPVPPLIGGDDDDLDLDILPLSEPPSKQITPRALFEYKRELDDTYLGVAVEAPTVDDNGFVIGDIEFVVPPTSFNYNSTTQNYAFESLRTDGNPIVPINTQRPSVTITLYIEGEDGINNEFRPLMAMYKRAPFTQIQSKTLKTMLIDRVYEANLDAEQQEELLNNDSAPVPVVLQNIAYSSVPGFPQSYQVYVTVSFFNHYPYGPMKAYKATTTADPKLINNRKIYEVVRRSNAYSPASADGNSFMTQNGTIIEIPNPESVDNLTTNYLAESDEFVRFYRSQLQDFEPTRSQVSKEKRWPKYVTSAVKPGISYYQLVGPLSFQDQVEQLLIAASARLRNVIRSVQVVKNNPALLETIQTANKLDPAQLVLPGVQQLLSDVEQYDMYRKFMVDNIERIVDEDIVGNVERMTDWIFKSVYIPSVTTFVPDAISNVEETTLDLFGPTGIEDLEANLELIDLVTGDLIENARRETGPYEHLVIDYDFTTEITDDIDEPTTILHALSGSYGNKVVPIDLVQYNTPTFQHLGMGQSVASMVLYSNDLNLIKHLNEIRLTQTGVVNAATSSNMINRGYDRLQIKDPLLNSIGLDHFSVRNAKVRSMDGTVGWYEVTIDLLHNPITTDEQEALTMVFGTSHDYVKSMAPYFFPTTIDPSSLAELVGTGTTDETDVFSDVFLPDAPGGMSRNLIARGNIPPPKISGRALETFQMSVDPTSFLLKPATDPEERNIRTILQAMVAPALKEMQSWKKAMKDEMGEVTVGINTSRLSIMIDSATWNYARYLYLAAFQYLKGIYGNQRLIKAASEQPTAVDLANPDNNGVATINAIALKDHSQAFMQLFFTNPTFNILMDRIDSSESWNIYDSKEYREWLKENHESIKNNYPDFHFREDITAAVKHNYDSTPADFHKILHPAWYFASETGPNLLDDLTLINNQARLAYNLVMSKMMGTQDLEFLRTQTNQLNEWLEDEITDDEEHTGDFQKMLYIAFGAERNMNSNTPMDLLDKNLFNVVGEIIDQENTLLQNNGLDTAGLGAVPGIADQYDVQMTKRQLFLLQFGLKMMGLLVLRRLLKNALGLEKFTVDVYSDADGNAVETAKNLPTKKPGAERILDIIMHLNQNNEADLQKAIEDYQGEVDDETARHVVRTLTETIIQLQKELIQMATTRDVDTALEGLGIIDIDAALLSVELDKKRAAQKHSDWKDSYLRAFPTFKMFIIEEDGVHWRMFDDFYSYDGVQSIDVVESKHAASSTALLRLSNVSGKLSNASVEDLLTDRDTAVYLPSVLLKPGSTVLLYMGYGPDYRNLPICFYGTLTDVTPGPILELKAQGFGAELLHEHTSSITFDSKNSPENNLGKVVLSLLDMTPGLRHFGRWKIHHEKAQSLADTSNQMMKHLYHYGALAGLAGSLVNDVDDSIFKYLGLRGDEVGPLDISRVIKSALNGTHPQAMLLNFGNALYDNIYINNVSARQYGFVDFVSAGYTNLFTTSNPFKWHIYNQTTWDALWEIATHLGDYIVRPLPYNEGAYLFGDQTPRMTLYMGPKEGYYKALDDPYNFSERPSPIIEAEKKRLRELARTTQLSEAGGKYVLDKHGLTELEANVVRQLVARLQALQSKYKRTLISEMTNLHFWAQGLASIVDQLNRAVGFFTMPRQIATRGEVMMLEALEDANADQDFPGLSAYVKQYFGNCYEALLGSFARMATSGDASESIREWFTMQNPVSVMIHLLTDGDPQYYQNPNQPSVRHIPTYVNALTISTLTSPEALRQKWMDAADADSLVMMSAINRPNQQQGATPSRYLEKLKEQYFKDGLTQNEAYRPVVEHHAVDSFKDIISNEIRATDEEMSNRVTVYYPKAPTLSPPHNKDEWPEDNKYSATISYDLDQNYIRDYSTFQRNIHPRVFLDYARVQDIDPEDLTKPGYLAGMPSYYHIANQILLNQMRPMYQGNLTIIGNPRIRPWHMVHITDVTSQMTGVIEVEEVVHSLNSQTGFTTTIKPNLACFHRNHVAAVDTQLMDLQAKVGSISNAINTLFGGVIAGGKAGFAFSALRSLTAFTASQGIGSFFSWDTLKYSKGSWITALVVGAAASGWNWYVTGMRQRLNSFLFQVGNAPIITLPLDYQGKAFIAGMEGIASFNSSTQTVLANRLLDPNIGGEGLWGIISAGQPTL